MPPVALFSLLALAADIPDVLPAGFLEQLPVMMQMRDEEYEALLTFLQSTEAADTGDQPTDHPAAAEENSDDKS